MPENTQVTTHPRGPGRPFLPGQSGNPAGRPKGSRNKATLRTEAMLEDKVELAGQVLDTALKEGKLQAARLVVSAFMPRPRAEGPSFEMPPIDGPDDVAAASAAVIAAASAGQLTPNEAFAMHKVVEARAILVGWAPPERAAPSDDTVVFLKQIIEHTPDGAAEPLSLFIPGEVIHRDASGALVRYRRIDPPTQEEIDQELRSRREETRRREALALPAQPEAEPRSPAPPAPAPEVVSPTEAEAESNLSAKASAKADRCIISQDTASPPPAVPKRPALIDAEHALAKWQPIAADEALPAHKREAARLEVLRYKGLVESLQAPGGPPILITAREPGDAPPPEPEPDWPPPPRIITIDCPLLWTEKQQHRWLREEGLQIHRSDELICRRPTKEPEIVSVVPRQTA